MPETTALSQDVNTATIPMQKLESDFYDWHARHADKVRAAASGNHDLIFIGDSITHLFEGDPNIPNRGEKLWREKYGKHNALNLGFGWDRTQNVLWRLQNGEFTGQTPRLAVLLIGTNNLTGTGNARANTPAEIVEGIAAIRKFIRQASPSTHVLSLAILPRSTPADPIRANIAETNRLLREWVENEPGTEFLDIGGGFMPDGENIPVELMDDLCHPTEPGYRIWAKAIEAIAARELAQPKKPACFKELLLATRSYRRFKQQQITEGVLRDLVDAARLGASGGNHQPLKYAIISSSEGCAKAFASFAWAAYLAPWKGPAEGERPTAYIVILLDKEVASAAGVDHGIAAQNIALAAAEQGIGSCMIGSINRPALAEALSLDQRYEILLAVALGYPGEEVILEEAANGQVKYYRDAQSRHHVPKRPLGEVIVKTRL